MRHKPWIALALTVAAGVLLALPALLGLLAERQTGALLARVDTRPGIRVESVSYERGWFRSRSRHRVTFEPAPARGSDGDHAARLDFPAVTLQVDSRFRHGPVPGLRPGLAAIGSELSLVTAEQAGPPLEGTADTRLGLLGGIRVRLESLPGEWRPRAYYGELESAGATLSLATDGGLRRLRVDARVEPLRFRDPLASGELERLVISLDQRRQSPLWTGTGRLEASGFHLWTLAAPRRTSMLEGLESRWEMTLDDGLYAGELRARAGEARFSGVAGRALAFDAGGGRMVAPALVEMLGLARLLVEGRTSAGEFIDEAASPLQVMLRHGPWLEIERLTGELPNGTLHGRLAVQMPELAAGSRVSPLRSAFGAQLDAQLCLPATVLAALRRFGRLAPLIEQALGFNVLERDGAHYSAQLHYESGLLTLNDRQIPVPVPEASPEDWPDDRLEDRPEDGDHDGVAPDAGG